MNTGIVVLGMHRSGTSAISGSLNTLGINFGTKLIDAQKNVNEKGFYEAGPVININNKLLCAMGSYWDDILPSRDMNYSDPTVKSMLVKAKDYISTDLVSQIWALKEPRVSILLPFWLKVFKSLNSEISFILIFRHPDEVSNSLIKRDGLSKDLSYLLWIKYNLESELNSRNGKRYILEFDDIFQNETKQLSEICEYFELNLTDVSIKNKVNEGGFISGALKNNQVSNAILDEKLNDIQHLAIDIYEVLKSLRKTDGINKVNEFDEFYVRYIEIIEKIPAFFKEQYTKTALERGKYENMFLEAYNSYWWKYLAPFRWLEKRRR